MRRSLRAYRSGWWRERRIWEIASPDEQTVQHLRERLRLSSLLAKVLCGRGDDERRDRPSIFAGGRQGFA
jgi:hypothetical protein